MHPTGRVDDQAITNFDQLPPDTVGLGGKNEFFGSWYNEPAAAFDFGVELTWRPSRVTGI